VYELSVEYAYSPTHTRIRDTTVFRILRTMLKTIKHMVKDEGNTLTRSNGGFLKSAEAAVWEA